MGTGKTTVLSEASDLLAQAGIAHAAIDHDWLAVMHPQQDAYGQHLAIANLAAVWPNYVAAGAERLIVARVVEYEHELDHYRIAVPGARPVVCRLTAPLTLMHEPPASAGARHVSTRRSRVQRSSPPSWSGWPSRTSPWTTAPDAS